MSTHRIFADEARGEAAHAQQQQQTLGQAAGGFGLGGAFAANCLTGALQLMLDYRH
ncbi:MAG: hypothetical protein JNK48_34410 [Bryobacterales bacterium]|nr:hypothetical protein [Bryobacterales bacterium]